MALNDINPATRLEMFLQGIADGQNDEEPSTRKEEFLNRIAERLNTIYDYEPVIPDATNTDKNKVMTVVPSTSDTPAKWEAVMPAALADVGGNDNILLNSMPYKNYATSDSTAMLHWFFNRGSNNITLSFSAGKSIKFVIPTTVTAAKATGQLSKAYRYEGNIAAGNGAEIGILNSGDTVTFSFEYKSDVGLAYLIASFSATVSSGTAPAADRLLNLFDVAASPDGFTRVYVTGTVPDWWTAFKTAENASSQQFVLAFKAANVSSEHTIEFRNFKLEFSGAVSQYKPAVYDNNIVISDYLQSIKIPEAPTANGTYKLTCTVSGGTPAYTWEIEAQ